METKYHIYYNNKCINVNLSEEEFNTLWIQYLYMAEIHNNFDREKLSFEEVFFNKKDYSIQGTI
jgi:hypothetical protein